MKKTIMALSLFAVLYSCASEPKKEETKQEQNAQNTATNELDPEAARGLELIAKSDCFTCHKTTEKSTGPSYMEVANEYRNKPGVTDSLVHKIIKGGVGKWGQIPMTPHPDLAPDSAKLMVKYILSLKEE